MAMHVSSPTILTHQPNRIQWKVLVLDPDSRRLIDNVLDEDTILNENITSTPYPPSSSRHSEL